MKTIVKLKYIRQSAKKIRFVLDEIRGLQVSKALNKLEIPDLMPFDIKLPAFLLE
jgi:ribosomal protein L22